MRRSVVILLVGIATLTVVVACIWSAISALGKRDQLQVTFLSVGQGDAILVRSPAGRHLLIDGGPDASVLRQVAGHMPWYDRSLDVVVATHPDLDHIGGLIDIFERYRVGTFLHSSVVADTPAAESLNTLVAQSKAKDVTAERGMVVDLGDGAYLEVLSPDRAVPSVDTNVGCVVTKLVYGKTSFMLPCDAPQNIEQYLVYLDADLLHANVLKAGHHGSKTSSAPLFVGFVNPEYVVYSRGCDNKYGFPSKETIATFKRFAVPSLDTCTDGDVTFVSDGEKVVRE